MSAYDYVGKVTVRGWFYMLHTIKAQKGSDLNDANTIITIFIHQKSGAILSEQTDNFTHRADTIHRIPYREFAKRTRKLSNALTKLGMKHGTKVGTFGWNHHRHLEAYFGVPSTGAILHMVNIRLSPEHIAYVINHAEDEILLVDDNLVPAS